MTVMYFIAIGLGIALIPIIYMIATKRKSTRKLLSIWFVLTFVTFLYSLSISNPPEFVDQFSTMIEYIFG